MGDKPGHPVDNGGSLSRTRSGNDQKRLLTVLDGFPLLGIQRSQDDILN